ncbi:MAG: ketoacyl-ACP synthase III [Planctomycetes bacterium]|nr:ketoacyl-ACP synthase III [Planctomycetota bacterium]
MKLIGVQITGTGSCLPEQVVTNEDLSKNLDTSDEWILSRTGIGERRFARPDEATSDFAIPAARAALEAAGKTPEDVDLVLCATMTPDMVMPTVSALVQRELGLVNAGGYDINSACTGFVQTITAGSNYIRSGLSKCCLVIGAETMTRIIDPANRNTAVIFADGAGAAVLEPAEAGVSDLIAMSAGLKGDDEVLFVPAGGSRKPLTPERIAAGEQYVVMKGRETFRFAVKTFARLITETCEKAGVAPSELAIVVPHQVNMRIIEAAVERTGITKEVCFLNIATVGNTSAASVAIALDHAVKADRIQRGDLVLFVAFGGGLSWASALFRW